MSSFFPAPLLSHRAGFGVVQPVTPLLNPSRTPDIVPVPVASTGSSTPLPSSGVCRPCPPGPRPPGMDGRPYPQFFRRFPQSHPVEDPRQRVERSLEPPQVGGGYHPVFRIKNYAFTFNRACPSSARLCPSSLPRIVRPSVGCPALLSSLLPSPIVPTTSYSQWRTIASTTTLKMVGDSVSPYVTPLSPWKCST